MKFKLTKTHLNSIRTAPTAEELVSSTPKDYTSPRALETSKSMDLRHITCKIVRELK